MTPRKKAFLILDDIITNSSYSNLAMKAQLGDQFDRQDRAFITALVYGTLDKLIQIDYIIDQYANGRVQRKVKIILRMGVYQILYMDKVPDFSACDQSVQLAKEIGKDALCGYINAVLRNIVRSKANIPYPDKSKNPIGYLSIKYSYPQALIKEIVEQYGTEECEAMLAYEPLYNTALRINTALISKDAFMKELETLQINYTQGDYFAESVYVQGNDIFDTVLFKEGKCSVQGEASIMAVYALNPQRGERILDACAAPGGKTVLAAQLMQQGKVVALDKHLHRVELIRKNAERCGCSELVHPLCVDAKIYDSSLGGFDRVLVDAPCSGLGVLGAKPEIKNTLQLEKLKVLEKEQAAILQTASEYCKPGSVLIYSTCTIRKSENQMIVQDFLEKNPNFQLESLQGLLPLDEQKHLLSSGMVQLLPHKDGIDGFFIACMRRSS